MEAGAFGIRNGRPLLIQHVWKVLRREGDVYKVRFHDPEHGFEHSDERTVKVADARQLTADEMSQLGIG